MADANFTADLSDPVFYKSSTSESVGEQIQKPESLQGVLTLQGDGELPDYIHTIGFYYVMEDVINGLKAIHNQIKSLEINLAEAK